MALAFEETLAHWHAPGRAEYLQNLPHNLTEKQILTCKTPAERTWVEQALLRQRYAEKLPAFCNHPEVILPPALHLQQASSEAVASYRASLFSGEHLVDITTGMGADLYFMQHGYKEAHGWEKQPELAASAKYNLKILGAHATVQAGNALPHVARFPSDATLFMDPDRRAQTTGAKADFTLHEPNPAAVWTQFPGSIILKAGPMTDVHALLKALLGADGLEIIAWKGDVREVLITRRGGSQLTIRTTRVEPHQTWEWSFSDWLKTPPLSPPRDYLFDPYPEVHKAGVYAELCRRYNLSALGASTRLFTGEKPTPNFPGRIYKNLGFVTRRSENKPAAARVISRNHPEQPESIRTAWKLKESETHLIAAITDVTGSKKYLAGELCLPEG